MRMPAGDTRGSGDVSGSMRIWQGTTPDGHAVLVERDARERWVVTVASAIRSRGYSLEAALLEAGGNSVSTAWASRVAAAIAAAAVSERQPQGSRTGAD